MNLTLRRQSLRTTLAATANLVDKPVDQAVTLNPTGDMTKYAWGIETANENTDSFGVDYGSRVQVDLVNRTNMAHPIHFHVHRLQIVQQNGNDFTGAIREAVYVPPKGSLRVLFDALHTGFCPVHCHLVFHLAAGMITQMEYNIQQ